MSDLMLYGVLRMPYDMAMSSELSRRQFYGRVQETADRLEAAEAELEKLRRSSSSVSDDPRLVALAASDQQVAQAAQDRRDRAARLGIEDATTKAAAPADAPSLAGFRVKLDPSMPPGAMEFRALAEDAREDRIVGLLREARATLEMWKDVAPAVSLCADIDKALSGRASSVPAIPGTGREKEWISVEDRLPISGAPVLIFCADQASANGRSIAEYRQYKHEDGSYWLNRFGGSTEARRVTHWMALPAAPSHPSEAKAGEPGPWQVLEMKDQPEPGRLLDVVLTNGVIEEGREHSAIDWTQWRYSRAKAGEDA